MIDRLNFDTTDANGWFYEQIHIYEECKEKIEKTNSNKIELIKKMKDLSKDTHAENDILIVFHDDDVERMMWRHPSVGQLHVAAAVKQ